MVTRPRSRCSTRTDVEKLPWRSSQNYGQRSHRDPGAKAGLAGSCAKMRELAGDGNGKILLTSLRYSDRKRGVFDVTENPLLRLTTSVRW